MNEVVSHLLTLLAGSVVGGLSKFFQDAHTKCQDTRAIAAALEAEISVSVEGIRNGHYIEMCDRIIAHVSMPNHTVTRDDYFDIALPETPCPVYDVHLSKIGLLGDATGPVVKTCQLYEAVCLDLRFIRERHERSPLNAKQLVEFHEALKVNFEEILKIGAVAMGQLQAQKLCLWQRLRGRVVRRYGSLIAPKAASAAQSLRP